MEAKRIIACLSIFALAGTQIHGESPAAVQQAHKLSEIKYPELPEAISSFGGVVSGDYLYVYSGHTGTAHDHSKNNLSQSFLRISISNPGNWQTLPVEDPLQGLAVVAHAGKIYRLGGLQAFNEDVDSPDLHSSDKVAVFDPTTSQWTSLTNLPDARSSHDAVVLGNQVFVVGGWNLTGDEEGTWHEYGLTADLSQRPLVWQKFEVPFQRRALAVSTLGQKIFVIGGMNADHDIERTVSIYDPKSKQWSAGPDLPGEGMNGFGVSAWSLNGQLLVSGTDGRIHRLGADGLGWQTAGKLTKPRFFHQLVPGPQANHVLAVAGASMRQGHLATIETIALKPKQ